MVANYGWAIVLLTAALKIALLPLSLSAFKSMRKMQELNPKMQAIRERWKGEAARQERQASTPRRSAR